MDDDIQMCTTSGAQMLNRMPNPSMFLYRFCESTSVIPTDISRSDEDALISKMLDSTIIELLEKTCPQCPRFTNL
uniref:Uncharacterized protein n=1 Tax=Heterorhabditis bacteriophora TaxID=37862 RepID=A0A1I7WN52_HETBA